MSFEIHLLKPQSSDGAVEPLFFAASETNGRENNEDSFMIFHLVPGGGKQVITCLALADGMGGHAYGELASSEALRRFARSMFEQICLEPALNIMESDRVVDIAQVENALRQAVLDTNAHVRRIIEANNWGQSGCTLVAIVVCGNEAVTINLGDSPAFCYNSMEPALNKITDDHNEAGVLLRAGLISKEMARVHEGRSRLVLYIGMKELPEQLPVNRLALVPGDRLLVCSDGISGELPESKLEKHIGQAGVSLETIASQLISESRAAGETDNQTLILWQHPYQGVAETGATDAETPIAVSSLTDA